MSKHRYSDSDRYRSHAARKVWRPSSSMSHLLIVNARANEALTMYRRATGCQAPGVKNGREQIALTAEIPPIANSRPCLVCEALSGTQLHADLSLAELANEVRSNPRILKGACLVIIVAAVQNARGDTSLRQQFHDLDHHAVDQHRPRDCRARTGLGGATFDRDQSVTWFATRIQNKVSHLEKPLSRWMPGWSSLRMRNIGHSDDMHPHLLALHGHLDRNGVTTGVGDDNQHIALFNRRVGQIDMHHDCRLNKRAVCSVRRAHVQHVDPGTRGRYGFMREGSSKLEPISLIRVRRVDRVKHDARRGLRIYPGQCSIAHPVDVADETSPGEAEANRLHILRHGTGGLRTWRCTAC